MTAALSPIVQSKTEGGVSWAEPPAPARMPEPTHDRAPTGATPSAPSVPTAPSLPAVDVLPDVIPPPATVDPLRGLGESFDRGLRGVTREGAGRSGRGIPVGDAPLDARYVDRAAVPLGTLRPRYPEMLRAQGVGGRAVVRFVVDTLGRVEPGSVELVSATHPAFGEAALRAVPSFRFRPAEAGGRRVRQLVQLPFEFVIE